MSTANLFKPYVARLGSELENSLHQELLLRFSAIDPQERPWYGIGLTLQADGSATRRLNFVIVPPTHIIVAHVFGLCDVAAGVVHGSPTIKEWWLETSDKQVLKMADVSPFDQAKGALHLFLPKLDGFLHSRKVKNPYVQSLLVFPDNYSFAGVQDVPIGPAARGAVTLVKISEVWQTALSHPREEKLDRGVFAAWLKTLLPPGADPSFHYTWIDPSSAPTPGTRIEPKEVVRSSDTPITPRKENQVITLSHEAEWSLGERAEEFTLPEKEAVPFPAHPERARSRSKLINRLIKVTGAGVLVLLILFIAHEVYMYLTPAFPPTPYWQGTTPTQGDQSLSGDVPSAPEGQRQDISDIPPASPSLDSPKPSPAVLESVPAPQPEAQPPPPSMPAARAPSQVSARADALVEPAPIKPAQAGTYETVRPTVALEQPADSASVVDRIRTGTKLNVVGSEGDWLVVRSRSRNATVYIRRGDAMLMSDPATQPRSAERMEQRWKEIELQIREAILRRGVPNITVSFIGDTAFLKGNVGTPDESQKAELAAKTIPDVKYVHNGIWVRR
ncbi:MAG: BON domain-containing protein [Candidatus Binatia bacterium]